jgi:hypothetical protein
MELPDISIFSQQSWPGIGEEPGRFGSPDIGLGSFHHFQISIFRESAYICRIRVTPALAPGRFAPVGRRSRPKRGASVRVQVLLDFFLQIVQYLGSASMTCYESFFSP